jgi:hypothetical protein
LDFTGRRSLRQEPRPGDDEHADFGDQRNQGLRRRLETSFFEVEQAAG